MAAYLHDVARFNQDKATITQSMWDQYHRGGKEVGTQAGHKPTASLKDHRQLRSHGSSTTQAFKHQRSINNLIEF